MTSHFGMHGINEVVIPFGTFVKGDKVKVSYIKGFYKLGTGIAPSVEEEKTIEAIRASMGKTYIEFTDGVELPVTSIESLVKVTENSRVVPEVRQTIR